MRSLIPTLMSLSLVALNGCTVWPKPGEGGLAELYQNAFLPIELHQELTTLQVLRLDLNHSQRHLDVLVIQGAKTCFPATVHEVRLLEYRIIREMEGGLFEDAEVDLITYRQQLSQLELKVDALASHTVCAVNATPIVATEQTHKNHSSIDLLSLNQLLNSDNQFATNSDQINPKYAGNLLNACKLLKEHPSYHLNITGHTDTTGEDSFNHQLAARRASAVVDFFQQCQLDSTRLNLFHKGPTIPLFSGTSSDVLLVNRRVDIKIVSIDTSSGDL